MRPMKKKSPSARLTVLLKAEEKAAFDDACAQAGENASAVLRELIQTFMDSGAPDEPPLMLRGNASRLTRLARGK